MILTNNITIPSFPDNWGHGLCHAVRNRLGDIYIAYVDSSGQLRCHKQESEQWIDMGQIAPSVNEQSLPRMAITSDDVIYCSFREDNGGVFDLHWATCADDVWTDLGLVDTWATNVFNHSLAVDGADTLWILTTVGSPVAATTLRMTHREGGSWTAPITVGNTGGVYGVAEVSLAIAADEMYIAFISSPDTRWTLYRYNNGAPVIIHQDVKAMMSYSMNIDRFDNVHIVGSDNNNLQYLVRYNTDGSWYAADILSSPNVQKGPCIVPLYNGELFIAYEDDTENKIKRSLYRDGDWESPVNVSPDTASEVEVVTRHARFPLADWNSSYIDVFYADEIANTLHYVKYLIDLPSSLHEVYYGYDLERTIMPSAGPDGKDYTVHVNVNRDVPNKLSEDYDTSDPAMYRVNAQVGTQWRNNPNWEADGQQEINYDLITHNEHAYPSQDDDTQNYLKGMPLGQVHVADSEIDEVMDIRMHGGGIALQPEGAVVDAAREAGLPVPDVGISRETAEEMRLSYADLVNGPPVNASRTLLIDVPKNVLNTLTEEQVHTVIQRHLAAGVGYMIKWVD